jgi:hypothetical protein
MGVVVGKEEMLSLLRELRIAGRLQNTTGLAEKTVRKRKHGNFDA